MFYRKEIDGLRTLAVFAVLFFHSGFLVAGYLGVDIFFVISGFLITTILKSEIESGNFLISRFYERRIRRIIPMTIFISIVSLILGIRFLLPDNLLDLSKSIIATSLFSNNILSYILVGYWDHANSLKPLMHTWSLGVEEQYYFIFPIFLIIGYRSLKLNSWKIFILLFILSFVSFVSNFFI